jgi:hypothetical protein
MKARCIAITDRRRCARPVAKRMGDLYVCAQHGLIQVAIIDDWLSPHTRRMLAFAHWDTASEGQRLIDRMSARRVA